MTDVIDRAAQALFPRLDESYPATMSEACAFVTIVLEAIREPTDAMCEAGYSAGTGDWGGKYDNRRELARGRIEPGWQAMIDAALSRSP